VLASLTSSFDPPSDAAAGLTALWEHLAERWAFVALGGGIVLFAWLVNRFAPSKRRRIRRTLIPFLIYLVLWAISATFAAGHAEDWAERVHVGAELFEIYTVINLTGLAVFDLALPALKIDTASIVADLIIGAGYLLGTIAVLRANGMEPGSVVATSAVVSGVLALSLQATLGNILGGVALQLDHSLHAARADHGRHAHIHVLQSVLAGQANACTWYVECDCRQVQHTVAEPESPGELRHDVFVLNIRYLSPRPITQLGELFLDLVAGEPPAGDRELPVEPELLDNVAIAGWQLEGGVQSQGAAKRRLRSTDGEPQHIL